ncbi:unnamed protein product [Vitrella brassicaformis CCMP3155]|uniref:Uncharacterized protein n=1 Tax=Vitrella brassicaformis (strain CCMP3155) TaxID=1169540 RepID=A0A0G4H4R3_VITBC|nr:unnamed protein product [Vitrella brassicaformis CCMP3155]|eukprot:CEM38650.1 unnamed protein product [Vitrella brassicaformis CCMP3155]
MTPSRGARGSLTARKSDSLFSPFFARRLIRGPPHAPGELVAGRRSQDPKTGRDKAQEPRHDVSSGVQELGRRAA